MTTSPPPRSSVALLEPRTAVSRELARERVIFWTAHRSRVVRRSAARKGGRLAQATPPWRCDPVRRGKVS